MNIKINNINYNVELDHNLTTNDILKNLPLKLHLSRYANHDFKYMTGETLTLEGGLGLRP